MTKRHDGPKPSTKPSELADLFPLSIEHVVKVEAPVLNREQEFPSPLGLFVHTRGLFTSLPFADRASMIPLLYAILDFERDEETYREYDKMTARELFRRFGVSKRFSNEAFFVYDKSCLKGLLLLLVIFVRFGWRGERTKRDWATYVGAALPTIARRALVRTIGFTQAAILRPTIKKRQTFILNELQMNERTSHSTQPQAALLFCPVCSWHTVKGSLKNHRSFRPYRWTRVHVCQDANNTTLPLPLPPILRDTTLGLVFRPPPSPHLPMLCVHILYTFFCAVHT